ncbi:MAG: CBS domain-containing protein [Candidatus Scalindua sp.]|jgi:dTDP-glucose pyrophosphorylase|nr:CBS domain-containing protein [Candidatus Scalindua sp.]
MLEEILIDESITIKEVLKQLTQAGSRALLVTDKKQKLLGSVTDGDIRRYILSGQSLDNGIKDVYNREPISIQKKDYTPSLAKRIILKNKAELVPIINRNRKVVDYVTWDQMFSDKKGISFKKGVVNIPVVIMAGGKGLRLDPFTRILPKALIPIEDKPIIEVIIDGFLRQGVNEYYLTLNHKKEVIESYFNNLEKNYKVKYVREKTFLGTAGSLKLLGKNMSSLFIVTNCDVIVKTDYEEIIKYHKDHKAVLTILAPIRHYKIPYGVIKFKKGGEVESIHEKPEYSFTINSGVYVVQKEILRYIPKDIPFDMTDLIKELIQRNKKVVLYPINDKDYIDIGHWEEYKKAINHLCIKE